MRPMTSYLPKIALMAALVVTSTAVYANQGKSTESIEQVEVVGTKSLAYYRTQMENAEVAFYDEFNKHAKKSKYKVTCKDEPKPNSYRITQKACYPQYFIEKKSDMVKKARQSGAPMPTNQDVEAVLEKEKNKSLQYAEKLVQKHPELKARLIEMYKSKQVFKKAEEALKD